jgi:O-antigen ligase
VIERLRPAIAPAYLFLCLLAGGSAQGMWGNALLRLLAIAIIVWAVLDRRDEPLSRGVKQLLILIGLVLLVAAVQLIPLPMSVWAELPGRDQFLPGFRLLGVEPAALPLSLAPYDSIATLLALLPPLGMLAAMIGFRSYSKIWLAIALLGGTVAGVLLGILQVTSPDPNASPWYRYRQSNFGVATGYFANSNHMASLLLVSIAFLAALGQTVRQRSKDVRLQSAAIPLVGGGLLVVVLGLILNGSLAGYGLGLPVVIASALMLFDVRSILARGGVIALGLGSLVALALLWVTPVGQGGATSVSTRQTIFANSVDLLATFSPVGTGLGTFKQVYRSSEDPGAVDQISINHAHNDYLELAIELGVPGILLILLFLAWWGGAVGRMLRSPAADQFAIAGAISSGAILLHSLVDYPLRTAAISTVFAMCLALILQSRRTARSHNDLRPTRHIVVD